MSKQIRPGILAILMTSTLLAGVAGGSAGAGQQRRRAVRAPAVRNTALAAATASVLKETSEIRKLSVLRPVRSSTQSRAEIERMLIKSLDEESTPAELHATEITFKKLGLAPAGFQFRQFLIQLLTEQVAGYYDPKSKQFYLADWLEVDVQKPVLAHELTHALQDQHFNLRRFEHWSKSDGDAELAAHALVEGDASLVMALYVADNPLRALSFLKSMTAGLGSTEQLDRAPRVLRETLLFPYYEGLFWTKELYKRGGWTAVSQAFTELPKSTEQILHAEKYFAKEPVIKVNLPDISPLLNANAAKTKRAEAAVNARTNGPQPPAASLWKRIDYDVTGEWGYYLLLDQFLKSADESKRAAAGWGGDRYAVYEQAGADEVFIVQATAWDSERDAREFFDAYAKRTDLRYPGAGRMDLTVDEPKASGVKATSASGYSWRTTEGSVVVTLRGTRVLVLECLPPNIDPELVAKSLGQ
ncbi:MAG: hypothetical protein QOE77_2071 [Blastocatellia bacterium]|jgi:hypothetical protein|nr:hypothetical protein [Blastocatellia bacterium]